MVSAWIPRASSSESLVSCRSKTSGAARSSHQVTLPSRALSEFTFHVAIRIRPLGLRLQAALTSERGDVPSGALGRREVGGLHELEQRALRIVGGLDGLVGKDELAELTGVPGAGGLHGGAGEARGLGHGV